MGSQVEKRLGGQVASYRRAAGITQEVLAERVDVSVETVSRMERGITIPSLATVERVAKALGVELHDLFRFTGAGTAKDKELEELARGLRRRTAEDIRFVRDLAERCFGHFGGRAG